VLCQAGQRVLIRIVCPVCCMI